MKIYTVKIYLAMVILCGASCIFASDKDTVKDKDSKKETVMQDKVLKTDGEWKKDLSPEEFQVLRKKGTEKPFSGKYVKHKEKGEYVCKACKTPVFSSSTKFDSGTGWPSFFKAIDDNHLLLETDTSFSTVRTEVMCANCQSHLGHVFNDGPNPTGLRYCINSVCLDFKPEEKK